MIIAPVIFCVIDFNEKLPNLVHVEPPAPTFQTLAQSDVTEQSITLRWDSPAGGADTYELTWEITNEGLSSSQTVTGLTGTCEYSIQLKSRLFVSTKRI